MYVCKKGHAWASPYTEIEIRTELARWDWYLVSDGAGPAVFHETFHTYQIAVRPWYRRWWPTKWRQRIERAIRDRLATFVPDEDTVRLIGALDDTGDQYGLYAKEKKT